MDQEPARHPIDRNKHGGEHDSSTTATSECTDRHGVDEIGHTEQVPGNRGAASVGFPHIPPVSDDRSEDPSQDISNTGRNRKYAWQLALNIANQEQPAEYPERLNANRPMLGNAGNDAPVRLREKKKISANFANYTNKDRKYEMVFIL